MLDLTQFEGHSEDPLKMFVNYEENKADERLLDAAPELLAEVKRLRAELELKNKVVEIQADKIKDLEALK